MWLNQVNQKELGLLKEELRRSTFLLRYLAGSLDSTHDKLRYAGGSELLQAQGVAQALEELLDIANQTRE